VRQRGLREQRDRLAEVVERVDLGDGLDAIDRVGGNGHRADGLLVALVTDVDDAIALARAHAHLVVHLGDERADRVDDVAAALPSGRDHLRRRAVGREHDRMPDRHLGDVVDEDHALALEALDDELVVDDLVVAVHRRLERPHHPRQRLDRHLDPRAEPPWLCEQDALNAGGLGHPDQLTDGAPALV